MIVLTVPSMHCESCVSYIKSVLLDFPLHDLHFNLLNRSTSFNINAPSSPELDEDAESIIRRISNALWEAGYGIQQDEPQHSVSKEKERTDRHKEHCAACQAALEKVVVQDTTPSPTETVLSIDGMTCSACTSSITSMLTGLPGVASASINLLTASAVIVHDEKIISADILAERVDDMGFEASVNNTKRLGGMADHADATEGDLSKSRTIQVKVDGMFCSECPARVNAYFASLSGVQKSSEVTLKSPVLTLTYCPSVISIRTIFKLPAPFIPNFYKAPSLLSRARDMHEREVRRLLIRCAIAAILVIPAFVVGVIGMILLPRNNMFRKWCEKPIWGNAAVGVIILGCLATVAQFGVGSFFYKRAWASFHSSPGRKWRWTRLVRFGNMDLLVTLSTSVAWVSSVAMLALSVRQGANTMDTGSSSGTMTYFDSSVFLVFFILMGRALQGRAEIKTGDAIAMLEGLQPKMALLVLNRTGQEKGAAPGSFDDVGALETARIPIELLEIGDFILLPAGSSPPADGKVVRGSTTVDESGLTGEALPINKGVEDEIYTGTVVLTSPIVMRVDIVGSETILQKIVQAVSEAHGRKAPIEQLADRITSVFVPIVVWLSLAVLIAWLIPSFTNSLPNSYYGGGQMSSADRVFFAFEFTIATLVVACPCGIGLAAPTAQTVGSGMAARMGVLVKGGGEAFQLASQANTIVFDKTGTITTGHMKVVEVHGLDDSADEVWVWQAIQLIQAGSTHPVAKALAEYATSSKDESSTAQVKVEQLEEIAGHGMKGVVERKGDCYDILIGNERLVPGSGHDDPTVQQWKSQGKSVVFIRIERRNPKDETPAQPFTVIGFQVAIADTPREDASAVIASLRHAGMDVYMLSGDHIQTARAVANAIGIEPNNVIGGVLPQQKAEFIRELQSRPLGQDFASRWRSTQKERRRTVLFCGDGLNDAAALAAADVSVALSHGSQITLDSASFVLLSTNSSLTSLSRFLTLARKVYRRQKMNFAWALVYNVIMIPLAAGAFYPLPSRTRLPPSFSALAMALSSGSVVLSSLALRWNI